MCKQEIKLYISRFFIFRAAKIYFGALKKDNETKALLFNEKITPKKIFSFFFFILTLGQIGIITAILCSVIGGVTLIEAISAQGITGNFLTFQISLIFSYSMYYFEEYGEAPVKKLFCLRATYLIASLIIAFLSMINYILITKDPDWENLGGAVFTSYNVLLYVFSIFLSYKIHVTFSIAEETAAENATREARDATNRAESIPAVTSAQVGSTTVKLND